MKIAVVGPGALGCLITTRLHQSGCKETPLLIDYKEDRAQFLCNQGITYSNKSQSSVHNITVALPQAGSASSPDIIIFCVKSYSLQASLQLCEPLLTSSSLALFLQNGISHLNLNLPKHLSVAFGTTTEGAFLESIGHVRHAGQGCTTLGFLQPPSEWEKGILGELRHTLCASGLTTELTDTIESKIWSKLLINIGINGLTAIYNCNNGTLLDMPVAERRMLKAVQEAQDIAVAHGVELSHNTLQTVRTVCKSTADNISSMLQDIRKGRKTEVESIYGEIIALGKKYNISCPENQNIYNEVIILEQQRPLS